MGGRKVLTLAVALVGFLLPAGTTGSEAPAPLDEARLVVLIRFVREVERIELDRIWARPGRTAAAFGTASLIMGGAGSLMPMDFRRHSVRPGGDIVYRFRTVCDTPADAITGVSRASATLRISGDGRLVRRFHLLLVLQTGERIVANEPRTVTLLSKPSFLRWVQTFNPPGPDDFSRPSAMSPLPDGGLLVWGHFRRRIEFGPPGAPRGTVRHSEWASVSGYSFASYLARIDAAGHLLWARTVGPRVLAAEVEENGLAVFEDGSSVVVVSDEVQRRLRVDSEPARRVDAIRGSRYLNVILRFGPDGNLAWSRQLCTDVPAHFTTVAAFKDGSCVAFWDARGAEEGEVGIEAGDDGSIYWIPGQGQFLEVHFGPNGDLRVARWFGGDHHGLLDVTQAVSFRDSSYVVVGRFDDSDPPFDLQSRGREDTFIACFAPSRDLRWVTSVGGEGRDSEGRPIALDDGSIVLPVHPGAAGAFNLNATDQSGRVLDSPGTSQALLARWDSAGRLQWTSTVDQAPETHYSNLLYALRLTRVSSDTFALGGLTRSSPVRFSPADAGAEELREDLFNRLQYYVARYDSAGRCSSASTLAIGDEAGHPFLLSGFPDGGVALGLERHRPTVLLPYTPAYMWLRAESDLSTCIFRTVLPDDEE